MKVVICFVAACLVIVVGLLVMPKAPEPEDLPQPTKEWVKFVTASYEARLVAMSADESMGADPAEYEMHSEEIRKSRAELVKLGELVEKDFEFVSCNALFDLEDDRPFDEFWEMVEQDFGRDILQEFLGVGFDFNVMIANQRKGDEFDQDAPWTVRVAMPERLMDEFEKVVWELKLAKRK
ncbi:MAG: hypothetical protein ABF391_14090 [Akkermansiaceae bacterium]|jgi:hypothetical protein